MGDGEELPDLGSSEPNMDGEANLDSGDKPFDDEPFDAGVEASEEEDPKKFIQQLSGKLGQSLRKYTDETGQPDFELEKFAINSVISATHTSEMDENDKEDIIQKINSSGMDDDNNSDNENNNNNDSDLSNDGNEISNQNDEEDNQDIKVESSQIWEPIDKESKPLFVDSTLGVNENKTPHKHHDGHSYTNYDDDQPINTYYDQKPIPMRDFDWKAVRGSWDLGEPIGFGSTEEEAINDLLTQEEDLRETKMLGETIDDSYTHFAILIKSNKIVNGWDYSGIDKESIREYAREDLKNDFPDNKLSDFKVVSKPNLIKSGLNPNDTNSWHKFDTTIEETVEAIYAFYLKENFETEKNNDIFEENISMESPVETPVKPKISEPERRVKRKSKPFHLPNKPQVNPTPKALKENNEPNNYQVYHNTYSSAIERALEYAENKGFEYSHEEYFNKVASGPKKPSDGETNSVSLSLYKDGEEVKEMLHIQIYGMGNKYELNCYIN